jgi:WD repeat-containing protein 45
MNFTTFNQDSTCFGICNLNGFFVYNCDPFRERFSRTNEEINNLNIIALLYRTNIVCFVGNGQGKYKPNVLIIWDDYQNKCMAELEFKENITAVKMRRDTILVATLNKIYIYNFADLKLLHMIETLTNESGLIDLSRETMNIVAYLGKEQGIVIVKNITAGFETKIKAHNNPVSLFSLNIDGNLLATASHRGTIIRIWDTTTGKLLKELRRGLEVVSITSIAFDNKSEYLVVCSNKGTVHIFNVNQTGRLSQLNYISNYIHPYFGSEWSSISFLGPQFCVCSFGNTFETIYMVSNITKNYYKYVYNNTTNTYDCIDNIKYSN